jgi:hypothetical protein
MIRHPSLKGFLVKASGRFSCVQVSRQVSAQKSSLPIAKRRSLSGGAAATLRQLAASLVEYGQMKTPEIVAALRENSIFSDLDAEELEFLASAAVVEHMGAGHVVFRHGERAKCFYLLLKGEISIEIPAIEGPTLFLQHLKPGQVLGWSWLIPPYQWSFMARAEQEVDVLRFDGATVLARCESDPEFGYHVLRAFSAMMSERLGHARRRIMDEWQAKGFG